MISRSPGAAGRPASRQIFVGALLHQPDAFAPILYLCGNEPVEQIVDNDEPFRTADHGTGEADGCHRINSAARPFETKPGGHQGGTGKMRPELIENAKVRWFERAPRVGAFKTEHRRIFVGRGEHTSRKPADAMGAQEGIHGIPGHFVHCEQVEIRNDTSKETALYGALDAMVMFAKALRDKLFVYFLRFTGGEPMRALRTDRVEESAPAADQLGKIPQDWLPLLGDHGRLVNAVEHDVG